MGRGGLIKCYILTIFLPFWTFAISFEIYPDFDIKYTLK